MVLQFKLSITANALIETDPAFTNRKKFLSSQFMIDALANNPERRFKRLGDGFYEQQLINEQIVSTTGKQYLEGYTDNEAEYKALLEAGIAFGKAFKLAPGISLSKEQMEAITTDMVWLETKTVIVDGKAQQVLYPKVYLAKQTAKSMDAMGGIISGKAIVSNTNTDILNQGIMTADTIVLAAHDVENTGRIDGRKVTIKASQDVINTGNIHGEKQVNINAGRDINVGAHVDRLQHHDIVGRQGTIGVGEKGDLVLSAKRDVNLKGVIVHTGDNSKATIEAGHNINVTTEALSSKKDMTVNSDNYNRTDRRTELGTAILSDSHVNLHAGNDVNIRNGIVNSEHGVTSVEAGNDVNITNGKSYSRDEYGLKYKEKSLLSRTTNIIRTDHEHTGVLSSTIGGDTINVKANRNVSVTGSNILGTKDVSVSAGNDVRTDSGEESQRDDVYQYSKKSGLMGAGIGFTIGSKKVTDTTDGRYKNQVATNISSSKGEINVNAGNSIHSTTTNYFSNKPIDLSARNVTVDGKHNTAHVVQSHEEKRSGLTVSVGGQIVNELNNIQQLGKRANSRKNSNLSTLEYLEAANTLKHAYNDGTSYKNAKIEKLVEKEKDILAKADELNKAYQAEHPEESNAMHPDVKSAINNVNNRAKKDRLLNIQVGIGSSKFKQVSELNQENYIGSSIGSKNKVNITADSDNSDKGNIQITGSVVEAPQVNLNASNNLRIDAGTNSLVQSDTYTSSGWSVGATVSPHGNGVIGLDANVYKGKENALETTKTHTGAIIRGKQVNTVSGKDTEITGSKVIGEGVTVKVGNDLKVESLQDINDYHKISKNKGISVSYGMSGPARVGFDNSRGTTDSHYASVTNQAGIYAGDGGYNVQVNNATTLTGGIIKGSPDKSKNKLSSNSLKMNDIQNEASYSAKTSGYSLSTTKRSKNNPIGITGSPKMGIPVKGSSKSTTHSAISEGIIEIAEKESLEKINHDTEQALNKLAPIFDKKTVEEKQILLSKISDHGYKLIGDIALHEQNILIKKIELAEEKGDKELVSSLRKRAEKWSDGGSYKVALHGAFGAVISDLSGYNGLKGLKTSAINEASQPILEKVGNPDLRKIISIIIAKSINSENIAPSIVNSAVDNNWLTHHDQMSLKNDYLDYKNGVISLDEWVRKLAYYDTLMWYEFNHLNIYNTNNEISMELYNKLSSDIIGSGSFQDVMNNLVYKYVTLNGLEDSFYIYKQEASEKIIRSRESSNKYKLNTPNIWNPGSNSDWGQSLNSTQTTNNNESYIMPYQNGIQAPDKRSNFRLVGDDKSNITGFYTKGDKGHLTFTNGIDLGSNGELSIFRIHHEVEKNAAKIELNGDAFYLAGDVEGKLGQGNIYVKAGALAALAHGNASYSLDFGNFLIVAEGNVYGGGLGAAFEGGIDREKGKGKIKFDIVDGVGAGGSITVQFKN